MTQIVVICGLHSQDLKQGKLEDMDQQRVPVTDKCASRRNVLVERERLGAGDTGEALSAVTHPSKSTSKVNQIVETTTSKLRQAYVMR